MTPAPKKRRGGPSRGTPGVGDPRDAKQNAKKADKANDARIVRPKGTRIVAPSETMAKGVPTPTDRRDAMFLFACDVEKRPVSAIAREHFPHLFEGALRQWAQVDGWQEKRAMFWKGVDDALFRDFQQRITRARMRELENLEKFSIELHGHIARGGTVKVKLGDADEVEMPIVPPAYSKREGAAKLLIALDERIDAKRAALMLDLPANASSVALHPQVSPVQITPEEARAMVRARLEVQERGALSAAADDHEADEDDEP